MQKNMNCFIISPSEYHTHLDITPMEVYEKIVKPACEEVSKKLSINIAIKHWKDIDESGTISNQIIQKLNSSEIVIADLTSLNPNVMWELGVRYSLRPHYTIPIALKGTYLPFDIQNQRVCFFYGASEGQLREAMRDLSKKITASFMSELWDSPVYDTIEEFSQDTFEEIILKKIKMTNSGIKWISEEWVSIRDENLSVKEMLSNCYEGDNWHFICINPEGFMPWREQIEDALRRGVIIKIAYLDLNKIAKSGNAGKLYLNSVLMYGFESAQKSIEANIAQLEVCREKARKTSSKEPSLKIYRSLHPHTQLIFLSVPVGNEKRGWGLFTPYVPYIKASMENIGIYFTEPGSMYDRYKNAILTYFDILEANNIS